MPKITELTDLASGQLAADDVFVVVDISTDTTYKLRAKYISGATHYYVDSAASDQGATDASYNTLKDLVDSISTDQAAIVFTNPGGAATTTYTLTTSLTVPSNINIEFQNGAQIDGAGTLTVYSPENIKAGSRQQIFDSSITINFTRPGDVYPGWWGAAQSGTAATNATAINAAQDSLPSVGGRILFPDLYPISGASVKIDQDNTILEGFGWHTGIDNQDSSGEHAIEYSATKIAGGWTRGVFIKNMLVKGNVNSGDGVRLERAAQNGGVDNCLVDTHGAIGVHLLGSLEVTVNNSYMKDCTTAALKLEPDTNSGCNANTFLGNSYRGSGVGIWLYATAASALDNGQNVFIGGVVEDNPSGAVADGILLEGDNRRNSFYGLHVETQDVGIHLLAQGADTPTDNHFHNILAGSITTDVVDIEGGFRNKFYNVSDPGSKGATIDAGANYNEFWGCYNLTLTDSGVGTKELKMGTGVTGWDFAGTRVVWNNNIGPYCKDAGGTDRQMIRYDGTDILVLNSADGDEVIKIHDVGRAEVESPSDAGDVTLTIDQNDVDQGFIGFEGDTAADATKNISTMGIDQDSGAGVTAGPDHANWDCKGLVKIEIGGAAYWLPAYQPN